MPKKSKIKGAVVVILLLLPSLFFLFLMFGRHHVKKLPYYGPKKPITSIVDGVKTTDTAYYKIPYFKFINQDGDSISRDDMFGHVYVVQFFFTTCPTICSKMAVMVKELQAKMIKNTNFRILSITVDPRHDSIPVLKKYAKDVHASKGWDFLTGKQKEIYNIAKKGFFMSAGEDDLAPGGYLHSSQLTLVDKEGHVRGYFDGTSLSEINDLEQAIQALYYNEHVPWKGKKKVKLITKGDSGV